MSGPALISCVSARSKALGGGLLSGPAGTAGISSTSPTSWVNLKEGLNVILLPASGFQVISGEPDLRHVGIT